MSVLLETNLPLPIFRRGKVRDVYDLGNRLLIVSTDRLSAFDFVLPCGIPDKGKVLNSLSAFWFARTTEIMPNHFLRAIDSAEALEEVAGEARVLGQLLRREEALRRFREQLVGRSMFVTKAKRIPVECVVRGYLAGSAWDEYRKTGKVSGIELPSGLQESQELPQPLFTPTTKSEVGHDRPLADEDIEDLGIAKIFEELKTKSLLVYGYAKDYAKSKGIIIADTKFEFGFVDGQLVLIDELLTPDSSRFWDAAQYQVGRPQASFDKQPVRDWLSSSGWDRESPPPTLPPEVIDQTARRYREAYIRLTGKTLR